MNKTDKQKNLLRNNNSLIILLFVAYVITVISGVYIYKSTVLINSCDQNNLFIETSLTIIGILVTFVIGYQIYNAVELKQSIDDRLKTVSTLKDELNKLKSESEKALSEIKVDSLVDSYFIALGKCECDYDKAIFNILTCIEVRINLESYIAEYEINKYSKCSVINYAKLCAYEYLLIDVICEMFILKYRTSIKPNIIYAKDVFENVNDIFEHIHERNIINNNEVFNKIYTLIKSADIKDCGYVYKREDVDSFLNYRNCFFQIHESDIIYLYKDKFEEAKLPIDK